MKNKKGFTLVELLGVIILLGILLLIGIPTIRSFIRRGEEVYYSSIEREMASAGGEYLNTYRTLFPRMIGHSVVVNLAELEANNYIDKVVDEDGNKCTGQVVVKKKKADSYEYVSCLKCGNRYVTDNAVCVANADSDTGFKNNEEDNLYDDKDDYRIVVPQEEYEVGQAEEFIIPEVVVQHKENGVWKDTNNKPVVSTKKVDTTKIGTKTVTYTYHGSKTSIKINVVDKVAPTAPEVVIKYNDQKGNNYQGNWYSGTLYVKYKSTDYTKKNIIGSGIKNYVYSLDGTTWTEVRKDNDKNKEYVDWNIIDANATENKIIPGDGAYTIYVKAIDKAGNESTVSEYVIKIDTTAPECAMKVLSGTPGEEGWYKSKITIGYDESSISGTTSKILTTPVKALRADGTVIATGAKTVEITTPEENIRVYGSITDEAGNVTVCETPALDGGYRIKLDPSIPKAPTITVHDSKATGSWHNKADTDSNDGKVTMTLSGASNLSKNIYYYAIDQEVQVNSDGRATNAIGTFDNRDVAAANIKAEQTTDTPGTTYYMRVCSVAGNCSETNTNYLVKFDKSLPNTPSSVVKNASTDEVISNANTWKNYPMWWGSFSATDNGPSGIDHYEYSTNCTGTKSGNLGESHSYGNGTNYTFCIRSVDISGNASAWSGAYYFKVDTTTPSVSAKQANTYITYPTNASPTNYFNITKNGISNISTVCRHSNGTVITNVNQLGLGVNVVTCTTTTESGNSASATTTFRHQYTATCTLYNERTDSACGTHDTDTCATAKECTKTCCGTHNGTCKKHNSCKAKACGNVYSCTASCPAYMSAVSGNGDFTSTSCGAMCSGTQGGSSTNWVSGTCNCTFKEYASCEDSSCSCKEYNQVNNTCTDESCCGCESWVQANNTCRRESFGCETYSCPSTGSSLISGTSTCTF